MIQWLFGIPYEVAFWEATYENKKVREKLSRFSHYNSPIQLVGFDVQQFLLKQPNPTQATILDVGAGMTYLPGNYLTIDGKNQPLNLHYIDPLAAYYNQILAKYKVDRPEVEFGMMEYLSAFYPNHDVTLIMIQNALDHSSNPVKGILESLDALHVGGVLYLNHHPNEAEYENYRGFHQFNIMVEDGQLIIWNKSGRFNINQLLSGFANVEAKVVDNNPIAIITKTAEVPENRIDRRADILKLSNALLAYSMEVNSASKMSKYHWKLFYYRIAQRVSKWFSWQTRQRIKRLLKRNKS